MKEIKLVKTSCACPEQYDAFDESDNEVGYLRLRNGYFSVRLGGVSGEEIYGAVTLGEGSFDEDEREFHLEMAKKAIKLRLG